jgi:hypothetical protein
VLGVADELTKGMVHVHERALEVHQGHARPGIAERVVEMDI